MRGEAVYADLGGGQNLVAILAHGKNASYFDGMGVLAMNAFAAVGRKVPFREVKQLSGTVQLNGNLIPTLVTFADVADPKTARVLDPANIEAAFGGDYHLKQAHDMARRFTMAGPFHSSRSGFFVLEIGSDDVGSCCDLHEVSSPGSRTGSVSTSFFMLNASAMDAISTNRPPAIISQASNSNNGIADPRIYVRRCHRLLQALTQQ
jgi:hypothetical protein